jgi:hypothetical protein
MNVFIISTIVATLLAASSAAPVDTARQFQVTITFTGAAGASFTQLFPADRQLHPISKFFSFLSFFFTIHQFGISTTDNFFLQQIF